MFNNKLTNVSLHLWYALIFNNSMFHYSTYIHTKKLQIQSLTTQNQGARDYYLNWNARNTDTKATVSISNKKIQNIVGKKIVFIFKFINTQFLLIKSENKQHSHNYSRNILAIMGAFEYCVGQWVAFRSTLTTKQKDILNTQLFANIFLLTL